MTILIAGFLALILIVIVCVTLARRLAREVEAEEADRILRAEYERFGQKEGES